jgi:uncharacterized protein (DUF58 family)
MAFSEVREYQYGDDVRNMDWNVTARLNAPFIKVFEEERELTVVLLIDVSGSRLFGSAIKTKKELMTEIAAVLSFSASANNDKVGALFFGSKVEKFIPPKKGRSHLLRIIRELIEFEPQERGTDIAEALRFLTNAIKKRCTAFKIAAGRHDLCVINVYDPRERELPDVGLIRLADSETGREQWADTSSAKVREHFNNWNKTVLDGTMQMLRRYKVDTVSIGTNQDYVKGLMTLFKSR